MASIDQILSHTDAADLARARAEIERLRAALEHIKVTAAMDNIPQLFDFCDEALRYEQTRETK